MPGVFLGTKFMLNHNCTFNQNGTKQHCETFFLMPSIYVYLFSSVVSGITHNVFLLFLPLKNTLVLKIVIGSVTYFVTHFDSNSTGP